jgi:hypothetical protein
MGAEGEGGAICRVPSAYLRGSHQTQKPTDERESGRRVQLSWAWAEFGLGWSGLGWLGWVGLD